MQHHLQTSRQETLDSSDASNWGVGEKFPYLMMTKKPSRLSRWIVHTTHCSFPQEAKRRVMLWGMRIFFTHQGSFRDILYHLMKDSKILYIRPSHQSLWSRVSWQRDDSSTPAHCSFSEPPMDHLNWPVKGQAKLIICLI